MSNDTVVLLQRVEKLERQNRLIKWAGLVVLLGIASMLFYGATTSKTKVFCSVSEDKKSTVLLSGDGLKFLDRTTGRVRVCLDGEPSLTFFDKNGNVCVTLGFMEGESCLGLSDVNGACAVLGIRKGEPALGLVSGDGKVLFSSP